jgi:putative serine protease PepD
VIVSRPPEPTAPAAPEQPPAPVQVGARSVAIIAVAAGLLAGALGGAVGFAASSGNEEPVVIGAQGGAPPAPRLPGTLPDIITRVTPSVVTVKASTGRAESTGSGFVIGEDGYILTNEHVVPAVAENRVTVTFADGTSVSAALLGRDRESDLAVLKVEKAGLKAVFIGNSDRVSVGDGVFAIGTPLALPGTVTAGIVSALDRTIEARDPAGERYYAAIQTDASVNRGSSGGPLFDYSGRVIGVNSVIKSLAENSREAGNIGIAFAIPINQAIRVASEIIDTGRARRTVVGAGFDTYDGPGGGVRVTSVDEAGPAAAAGLRIGDVVLRLDNHPIESAGDLIALVRRHEPGHTVNVTYRRGGNTQLATVVLAADVN